MREYCVKNRGQWLWLALVVGLAILAWIPVAVEVFGTIGADQVPLLYTLFSRPVVAAAILTYFPAAIYLSLSSPVSEGVFSLFVCLVYYALLLSPTGVALMVSKGKMEGFWRRKGWLIMQAVYFLFHLALIILDPLRMIDW